MSNYLWLNVIYKYVDPRQNDIHGFPGIKGKFLSLNELYTQGHWLKNYTMLKYSFIKESDKWMSMKNIFFMNKENTVTLLVACKLIFYDFCNSSVFLVICFRILYI